MGASILPADYEMHYYLIDSGCNNHLAGSADQLEDVRPAHGLVTIASGKKINITLAGYNPRFPGLVYVVPGLHIDLVSLHQLEAEGLRYGYENDDPSLPGRTWTSASGEHLQHLDFSIFPNNVGLMSKVRRDRLSSSNRVRFSTPLVTVAGRATKLSTTTERPPVRVMVELLHHFGHFGLQRWLQVVQYGLVAGIPINVTTATIRKYFPYNCKPCVIGMAKIVTADRASLGRAVVRKQVAEPPNNYTIPGQRVYVDIADYCGKDGDQYSWKSERYAIKFTDAATRCEFTVFTINRAQILGAEKQAIAHWAIYGHRILEFKSDNEFANSYIGDYLSQFSIKVSLCTPHEKFQNGVVERSIGVSNDHTRATIIAAHPDMCAQRYWPYAWTHQEFANNATKLAPNRDTTMSALEAFTGTKLDITKYAILPWGCKVEALLPGITNKSYKRTEPAFNLGISYRHQNVLILLTNRETIIHRRSFWQMSSPLDTCSFGEDDQPPPASKSWLETQPQLLPIYNGRQDARISLTDQFEQHLMGKEDHSSSRMRSFEKNNKNEAEFQRRKSVEAEERLRKQQAVTQERADKLALRTEKKQKKEEQIQFLRTQRIQKKEEKQALKDARPVHRSKINPDLSHTRVTRGTPNKWPNLAASGILSTKERDMLTEAVILSDCTDSQLKLLRQDLKQVLLKDRLRLLRLRRSRNSTPHTQMYAEYRCMLARVELQTDGAYSATLAAADVSTPTVDAPKGYQKMLASPDVDHWLSAVEKEVAQLQDKMTWIVVEAGRKSLPKGTPIYSSVFIFTKKHAPDSGDLLQHKARLVLNGAAQANMPDNETYAPTVNPTTVKTVVAISAATGMVMSSLDVSGAFLIEGIDRDTYMRLPLAYTGGKEVIVKLSKSLYGLRQAPRLFAEGMRDHLQSIGFKRSLSDNCLYYRKQANKYTYITVHVDDLLIAGPSVKSNTAVRDAIQSKYTKLTWNEKCTEYLGINFRYNKDGSITLNQPAYRRALVDKFDLPSDLTPMDSPHRSASAHAGDGELLTGPTNIRALVGAAQYATGTAPEITCALNQVAKLMHSPTQTVMADALHIVLYLASNPETGITYHKTGCTQLQAWVDSSWLSEPESMSRTGYCLTLGNSTRDPVNLGTGILSAFSKVQTLAALSSTQAEIIALSECLREVMHLRMLLEELGLPQQPTPVYEDNAGAISFAEARPDVARSKHILIKDRFCVEAVEMGWISMVKIDTSVNCADMFTKHLGNPTYRRYADQVLGNGLTHHAATCWVNTDS